MAKKLLASLLVALIAVPVVHAKPPKRADDDGSGIPKCYEAKTVSTPCVGVLMPSEAAAEALECLTQDLPECQLKLTYYDELRELERRSFKAQLQLEQKQAKEYRGLFMEAIKLKEPPPWYESPILWTTIGFVVGAGATIAITYAVNE